MMKGIFDRYYQIDIISEISEEENDVISYRITYNKLQYPDFYDYITKKILKEARVFYEDEIRKGDFFIISISLANANPQSEHLNNQEIPLRQEYYGDIVNKIPAEQKKAFLINQYYGKIRMKRK